MRCSICRSKNLKALELSLARGLTQARVALKYRVSKAAVQRHARNCMRDRSTREIERDLRRLDRAIRAALEKNAGANIAPMLTAKYDLLDRLEQRGEDGSGPKVAISVIYEHTESRRAQGRGDEVVGRPLGEADKGIALPNASSLKSESNVAPQGGSLAIPEYQPDPYCQICQRSGRVKVDTMIGEGRRIVDMVGLLGYSREALNRHKDHIFMPQPEPETNIVAVGERENLLKKIM